MCYLCSTRGVNVCGVLLSLNCLLRGGKGDVSSALQWTLLNEKIQKNLIKVSQMRQHIFLFYDQNYFYFKLSLSTCFISTAGESLPCMVGKVCKSMCVEKKKHFPSLYFFVLCCQTFLCIRFQNSLVSWKSLIKSVTSILNMSEYKLYRESARWTVWSLGKWCFHLKWVYLIVFYFSYQLNSILKIRRNETYVKFN